jgi:hypothetical protein
VHGINKTAMRIVCETSALKLEKELDQILADLRQLHLLPRGAELAEGAGERFALSAVE